MPPSDPFARLQADCARCRALCCVGPAFAASADFAVDKPAGQPCVNLSDDDRCGIHTELRPRGFPGCVAYDCFGAGQQVVQVTFGGRDREPAMFAVLPVVRALNELLWYLAEVRGHPATGPAYSSPRYTGAGSSSSHSSARPRKSTAAQRRSCSAKNACRTLRKPRSPAAPAPRPAGCTGAWRCRA